MEKGIFYILAAIFILSLALRFLYFPNNIYFGFDQARDAFAALDIIKGNFKVIGPPTGVEGWFHGPLYYYIYAPIYFISSGNPEWVAAFLRIINAGSIFLVFLIGMIIFDKWVGLLSAFLFAISFEQTQYSIYFNHPSLAVVSVLIFYLGLSLFFFKKETKGLIIALVGLGLSIQFEFILTYLIFVLMVLLILGRKRMSLLNLKTLIFASSIFLMTISSFIIAELKFNFRFFKVLFSLLLSHTVENLSFSGMLANIYLVSLRLINDNLIYFWPLSVCLLGLLLIIFLILLKDKNLRFKLLFLFIWFLAGSLPFLGNISKTPLYYYSVGASISLLIFASYLIQKVSQFKPIVGIVPISFILVSNIFLITSLNPKGPMPTINVQSGMLLSDEKNVVDYIYNEADNLPFAINALSMPLYINTTWSYLFQWWGLQKYHYLPFWGGVAALGYPGNLQILSERSELPQKKFLILEPNRGIRPGLINKFMEEEGYFSNVVKNKKIGEFVVQSRIKK